MFSNRNNEKIPVIEELSIPFEKTKMVDDLFAVIQNIIAGTAVVSKKILSENGTEFKIELLSNSPIIILQYESKCENERIRMIPITDYKIMDGNSGTVDNTNIIKHQSIITYDERRKYSSPLLHLKHEIPELLLVENCNVEINGKSTENDLTLKSYYAEMKTGSTSHSINNFYKSVISSSGGELIASDLCMVTLQTEEQDEHEICDEKRKKKRSEGIRNDNGISKNKGKAINRNTVKEQHPSGNPFVGGECGKYFKPSQNPVENRKILAAGKPFTCEDCGKSFSFLSAITRHKRIHTGEKPFKCDYCSKSFSDSSSLIRHKRIHTGEKPFVCEICQKSFTYLSSLTVHKRTHTGEKSFKCDVCGKGFTQLNNLTCHKKIHTGAKPFKCDLCDKCFSDSRNLILHKKTHRVEKPFKCEECGKNFTHLSDITRHVRIHTGEKPFHCDYCGKSFTDSSSLIRHKRIHTGEKPFECEVCYKSFTYLSSLTVHKRTHRGEKPFKCEECGKSFTQLINLTCHERVHVKEKAF